MSVLVAGALDAVVGEPPVPVHPVVAAGRYLDAAARFVPAAPSRRALVSGGAAWLAGALGAVAAALAVERVAARAAPHGRALLRGLALWPLLSARLLLSEVRAVERALDQGLPAGRTALSRIVSRDTHDLTAGEVRAAAVESLTENLSDSVVAPLFWYGLAGLPGAAVYRFANTADACWGYRTDRWEHAGRCAALADDVLNVVPARLTAALLRGRAPWARIRREAARTSSPNAGWPMAAAAVRLDLRLTKRGHYALHPSGREPAPGDVDAAIRLAARAALLAVAATALAEHLPLTQHRPHRRPVGGPR